MADSRFELVGDGVEVRANGIEVRFLGDAVVLLEGVGNPENDPGAARLSPPVYLGDPESDAEWRRLAGGELNSSRRADRSAFELVLGALEEGGADGEAMGSAVITELETAAFMRVINEVRLVLAARWGVDTEEDFARLRPEADQVLGFLGWLITDLAEVLSEVLDAR